MTEDWTTSLELLLTVRRGGLPLRHQIEEGIRAAVRSGRLRPATRLPSTRALANDLAVARGIVVEAYAQLVAEGYLVARRGAGTSVAPGLPGASATPASAGAAIGRPGSERLRYDFRPGVPDLASFPRSAWLRASRISLGGLADAELSYRDPRGLPQLRVALADYLGRVRGVQTDPSHIVVTNGFAQGLSLVVSVLAGRAGRSSELPVGVEDPGAPGQLTLLEHAGGRGYPIPVDSDGIDLRRAADVSLAAVLVTPAHQFPTGVVMSPSRRAAIVAWARRTDGLVIEDDYDAEYRFDREPVGAVQGLAPAHVVYAGSVSKSLAPALRLGWLAVPGQILEEVLAAKAASDLFTAVLPQAALAELISAGALDRHLRRTRRLYRQRRDALAAAVARYMPGATVSGAPAGLHLVVHLPDGVAESTAVDRAAAASVGVYAMTTYRLLPRPRSPAALVLGYALLTPEEIDRGVRLLADCLGGSSA